MAVNRSPSDSRRRRVSRCVETRVPMGTNRATRAPLCEAATVMSAYVFMMLPLSVLSCRWGGRAGRSASRPVSTARVESFSCVHSIQFVSIANGERGPEGGKTTPIIRRGTKRAGQLAMLSICRALMTGSARIDARAYD